MTYPTVPSRRGVLFPRRLPPAFTRVPAGPDDANLVAWWWISVWNLPDGETSAQHVLAFPASNLVVEDTMVGLTGPTTRASTRELRGRGWALGALLRPAAAPAFGADPGRLRDRHVRLDEDDLRERVAARADLTDAIPVVAAWLHERVGPIDDEALLANRMADAAGTDTAITTVAELAGAVGVSERTVHRIAARYVGLTPYAMIRRRRLQEAAEQVREHPDRPLADIAAEHGFADQAHLTREFRTAIGHTPAAYRAQGETR